MTKKLFIKTYGCQMNVYDSARMADVLAPIGYGLADAAEDADMVILNTCHIREKASEKVFSELGRLRRLKEAKSQAGGRMVLAVAGCVAQAEGAEIARRAPYVDMVFGPQTYHRLPEMVAKALRKADGKGILDTDFPLEPKFDHLPEIAPGAETAKGAAAFLSIQEGCDKFCSFCVVPYTRGAEYSRPAAQVISEARKMAEAGVIEITLLGQNVNAYRADGTGLAALLGELAKIEGLARLRYTTSHPNGMDEELIRAHAEIEKLMPYLHLPIQSGSDGILKAMNRNHGASDYKAIVARLRAARPDIALSSDFIVGFPGETEQDFQATLDLAEEVGFAQAYSFKYSARPGTPAAALECQVPEPEKEERLARLQALLDRQQAEFNRRTVGRTLPVLLESKGRKPGQLIGRSPYMQSVHVAAPEHRLGRITDLSIVAAHPNSLSGSLDIGWRESA